MATRKSSKRATANGSGLLVKNKQDYEDNYSTGQGSVGTFLLDQQVVG